MGITYTTLAEEREREGGRAPSTAVKLITTAVAVRTAVTAAVNSGSIGSHGQNAATKLSQVNLLVTLPRVCTSVLGLHARLMIYNLP